MNDSSELLGFRLHPLMIDPVCHLLHTLVLSVNLLNKYGAPVELTNQAGTELDRPIQSAKNMLDHPLSRWYQYNYICAHPNFKFGMDPSCFDCSLPQGH
jgi:hypothetical protein